MPAEFAHVPPCPRCNASFRSLPDVAGHFENGTCGARYMLTRTPHFQTLSGNQSMEWLTEEQHITDGIFQQQMLQPGVRGADELRRFSKMLSHALGRTCITWGGYPCNNGRRCEYKDQPPDYRSKKLVCPNPWMFYLSRRLEVNDQARVSLPITACY